jgi:hypothetical protein
MNETAKLQVAQRTVEDRYLVAFAKNPDCPVCNKPITDPSTALLLESNERLVHPGNCSTGALKHAFIYARRGLKGRGARGSR